MSLIRTLSFIIFSALYGCANSGVTETGAATTYDQRLLGPELRAQSAVLIATYHFLSYQCGADTPDREFDIAVAQLPEGADRVFISILNDGAPQDARATIRDQAAARFERRQAWLRENGQALFGADADDIARRNRNDYIDDALARTNYQYRENAIRALGYIGGHDALAAVQMAAAQSPALSPIALKAADRIQSRAYRIE